VRHRNDDSFLFSRSSLGERGGRRLRSFSTDDGERDEARVESEVAFALVQGVVDMAGMSWDELEEYTTTKHQ
jgi:hypothetical protein